MTNILPPIVFFGTEDFSARSLEVLLSADFPVRLVVTKPDTPSGRGQTLSSPRVKHLAEQHSIAVLQPTNLDDIIPNIETLDHPAGVLVSYGKIIPEHIIDLFSPGIINLHPSLLPFYRGPSPIETAILNGDEKTGVSIMRLEAKMDAGPVYVQQTITLKGTETKPELYAHLAEVGANGLAKALPLILNDRLPAHAQNHQLATYTTLLNKQMAILNPTTMSATAAERQVRAFLGFPRSRLVLHDQDCIILQTHVSPSPDPSELAIRFQDGQFLVIEQLIAPSGKTISGTDFLRGYAADT